MPDVENAPLEEGRDPLGDHAPSQTYRRTGQLVLAVVVGIVFMILGLSDITSGHVWRGLFGLGIAALNAYIAVKERAKPRPKA